MSVVYNIPLTSIPKQCEIILVNSDQFPPNQDNDEICELRVSTKGVNVPINLKFASL